MQTQLDERGPASKPYPPSTSSFMSRAAPPLPRRPRTQALLLDNSCGGGCCKNGGQALWRCTYVGLPVFPKDVAQDGVGEVEAAVGEQERLLSTGTKLGQEVGQVCCKQHHHTTQQYVESCFTSKRMGRLEQPHDGGSQLTWVGVQVSHGVICHLHMEWRQAKGTTTQVTDS